MTLAGSIRAVFPWLLLAELLMGCMPRTVALELRTPEDPAIAAWRQKVTDGLNEHEGRLRALEGHH